MSTEPLVSVVVLTYNGEKKIDKTLDSVLSQNYKNTEIIVVDNASEDKTIEKIETAYPKKISIVKNRQNFGFAEGYNVGIHKSAGDYILCLNDDTILDPNFISETLKIFRKNKKAGAVQGKLVQKKTKIIDTTGIRALKNRRFVDRGQGEKDKRQYTRTEEVFGFNGAAPIFRRACLNDVKLNLDINKNPDKNEFYDRDFFMYKEDVDLSWRMRLYGWEIIYCPKAIAYPERTSISSSSPKYLQIASTRWKQRSHVKYLSFKNQRLIQIKNDMPWLVLKHLPWILPKEIISWFYILLLEPKTWPAIKELFRQIPKAWKKRKIIMKNKRVNAKEIGKWFK